MPTNTQSRGMTTFNNLWQLALLNLFVVAMAAGTIWFGWRGYTLTTNGETATGRVVAMDESSDGEGGCCVYSPIIDYQANGRTFTFESMNASSPPAYQVGQEVEVIYNRDDPNDAAINSFSELWLSRLCFVPQQFWLRYFLTDSLSSRSAMVNRSGTMTTSKLFNSV